ncbi:MAG: sigma-70 family RNA polymerase sigma factor [Crocinitomicaceae bacterium]|nr:sigma-70 family RNA polymerase sigma factor [Crocinitomicaceae bacterium]
MSVNPAYHQSNSRMLEELEWVQRAKADPEQFAPLYKKYHEQIFRYIYQRMDDEEMAFDITSQVFMKAIKNLHKYEFRGVPFASWLYRIAKSELYQSFRDNKAIRTVNIDTVQVNEFIDEFDHEESEQNRKRLMECLAKLNEEDMQLLELRYFEKRSFKEIGEILDVTENNAKVKSFRAIEKLKKIYLNKLQ